MLAIPPLDDDLLRAADAMARLPLHELLEQQGILRNLAREVALNALRQGVRLERDEALTLLGQACADLPCDPPTSLEDDWMVQLPEPLRVTLLQRWNAQLLQRALAEHYGEKLEAHFLDRRQDLEQVVFRLMRLPQQGLAEELYLRLVDDQASFGELASLHSLGDERMTRGIVGPIECGQLHAGLRQVLHTLTEGQCHPPFLLENTIHLVRLEHRRPAALNAATRLRLLEDLLQPDLQAWIESGIDTLRRCLDPAPPLGTLVATGG
jgi:hypothetical protein